MGASRMADGHTALQENVLYRRLAISLCAVMLSFVSFKCALAQTDPAAICGQILVDAGRDQSVSQGSSQYLNAIYSNYCSQSGSVQNSSLNIGLSAVIESIPVGLTLGSSDASTAINNFCKNYSSTASATQESFSFTSTVVSKALDTVTQCMEIARSGAFITHKIINDEAADIYLTAPNGNQATLEGVATTGRITCDAAPKSGDVKANAGTRIEFSGPMTVHCVRQPSATTNGPASGTKVYDDATVSVGTNNGPYAFLWPRSTKLAQNNADQIEQEIEEIEKTIIATNSAITQAVTKVRLSCTTTGDIPGNTATCPADYTVVACMSGSNRGTSFDNGNGQVPNGCFQQAGPVDWTAARCCRPVYSP